jgi:hypothetical protein
MIQCVPGDGFAPANIEIVSQSEAFRRTMGHHYLDRDYQAASFGGLLRFLNPHFDRLTVLVINLRDVRSESTEPARRHQSPKSAIRFVPSHI